MKGKALAAGAAVGAVVAIGVGARQVTAADECLPPLTLFAQEQDASLVALERYIETEIAPSFKEPAGLLWASDDYSPTLKPGLVAARIMLMEPLSGIEQYYNVRVVRDCVGDAWRIEKFERVKER